MAEIRYGKRVSLEKELEKMNARIKEMQNGTPLLKEEVTEQEIAMVVSRWTGIPVSKMLEGEKEKLLKMESLLEHGVVGQKPPLIAISDAVRRSRSGIPGSQQAHGLLQIPGPHRRGKDRDRQGRGRVPLQ